MVVHVGAQVLIVHLLEKGTLHNCLDPMAAGRDSNRPLQLLRASNENGWMVIHPSYFINKLLYNSLHMNRCYKNRVSFVWTHLQVTQCSNEAWLWQVGRLTVWPLCPSSVLSHECKSTVGPSRLGLKIESSAEEPFVSGWRHHAAGIGTERPRDKKVETTVSR